MNIFRSKSLDLKVSKKTVSKTDQNLRTEIRSSNSYENNIFLIKQSSQKRSTSNFR